MKRYSIGAVTFMVETVNGGRMWADLIGPPRVEALRKFYRKQPVTDPTLGDLIPWVYGDGAVTWDQVNWDTAGERVTGG